MLEFVKNIKGIGGTIATRHVAPAPVKVNCFHMSVCQEGVLVWGMLMWLPEAACVFYISISAVQRHRTDKLLHSCGV